ncbi:MAG TPA: hypothetical protein VK982_07070 [Bacteroidales bacterium]|nr:hypothetical protein [Bacteroidales bacterium]
MIEDVNLSILMYLLEEENKYSSKLYHYLEDNGVIPEKGTASEFDPSTLNKYEFGLLKQIYFSNLLLREIIFNESSRRRSNLKKKQHAK